MKMLNPALLRSSFVLALISVFRIPASNAQDIAFQNTHSYSAVANSGVVPAGPNPEVKIPDTVQAEHIIKTSSGTLTGFLGYKKGKVIVLEWTASRSISYKDFTIERSVGGYSYVRISVHPGKIKPLYTYTDKNIFQEAYYYRIRVRTASGKIFITEPITVNGLVLKKKMPAKKVAIKPSSRTAVGANAPKTPAIPEIVLMAVKKKNSENPVHFSDQIAIRLGSDMAGKTTISISNQENRVTLQREFNRDPGNDRFLVDSLDMLPEGDYRLLIRNGNHRFIYRLTK